MVGNCFARVLFHKYFVDEIYQRFIVSPVVGLVPLIAILITGVLAMRICKTRRHA